MAYSGSDLTAEIRQLIDKKIKNGGVAPASWVALEIANRHRNIKGEDAEFHFFCTHRYVRSEVSAALKYYKCDLKKKADPQLVLPGYERLHHAYTIERAGEETVVPIDQCSDAELEAKAFDLEAMASGATEHASEIRRYIRKRRDAA